MKIQTDTRLVAVLMAFDSWQDMVRWHRRRVPLLASRRIRIVAPACDADQSLASEYVSRQCLSWRGAARPHERAAFWPSNRDRLCLPNISGTRVHTDQYGIM